MAAERLALLLVVGCGVSGPAAVTLGTGTDRFEPVERGATLPIIQGPQGGFHLPLNVRAKGFDARSVSLTFTGARTDGGTEVCRGLYPRAELAEDADGTARLLDGARCYVDDPLGLMGVEVDLAVSATDARSTATDVRHVTVGPITTP